jgi:hypothetical protein
MAEDHEVTMAAKQTAAKEDAAQRASASYAETYWQWAMVAMVGAGVIVLATSKRRRWGA